MEFPKLFDEPEEPEQAVPEPETPSTALAIVAEPAGPVREIIGDSATLKKALDEPRPVAMLGEDLLSQGYITKDQLDGAIKVQSNSKRKRLGQILIEIGAVSQEIVDFVLAGRLGVPAVDLRKLGVEPETTALVPKLLAHQHALVPCMIHKNRLVVAMENPMDYAAMQAVEFACGKRVLAVLASKDDISWAISHYYRNSEKRDRNPMYYWT